MSTSAAEHGSTITVARLTVDPRITPEVLLRFWEKVRTGSLPPANPSLGNCWLWTAAKEGFGYGAFTLCGDKINSHVLSWVIHNGPVPDGLEVCHSCDNPPCVRPDHLFAGTRKDNMLDASRKGRLGRWCGPRRFSAEQIVAATEMLIGGSTVTSVAKFLNAHLRTVQKYRERGWLPRIS